MHLKIATVLATLSIEELNMLLDRNGNPIVRIRNIDVQEDYVQYLVVFKEALEFEFMSNTLEPNEAYISARVSGDGKIDLSF